MSSRPIKIFFCYAREDEELLNKLKSHLRPLQREGLIDVWNDREISAGTEWEHEIKEHLNSAQIILLLVSPDFMNSDYCYSVEMKRALERHASGEANVIPVILRPVYWYGEPLGKLQALPTDGKPVKSLYWFDPDSAFYDVIVGIRKVVNDLTSKYIPISPVVAEEMQEETTMPNVIAPTIQQADIVSLPLSPFEVEKLTLLHTLTGHRDDVRDVAISPDGQTLVSGSADKTIKTWNLSTGRLMYTLTGHTYYVASIAISPDGQTLVSGGEDGEIKVWHLPTGKEVGTLIGHKGPVWDVAIGVDEQTLVSGSLDNTIKVWNLSTAQPVRTLTGHAAGVLSVAISPNGQILVSGSDDKTIKIWNLPTGQLKHTLTEHTASVEGVTISADGKTLVSGSYDKTIKIWNLPTGQLMHSLTVNTHPISGAVYCVAISPDGQTLVSGGADKTIKVWGMKSK